MATHRLFVTAATGTADLIAAELEAMGGTGVRDLPFGAECEGTLEVAYRACLWSRVGLRVLLRLGEFPAPTPEALYAGIKEMDWSAHLGTADTLAVDLSASRSAITHTQFGALKVKDAIVDQFRERTGVRPSVDTATPSVRVNVRLDRDQAVVSLDLAGESLHRRGYRERQVAAPLKENLAAAMLLRAGWAGIAHEGGSLVDPMCGSGTLPIEAALIAGDIAPGLMRTYFGFLGWRGHDAALWERLRVEADQRRARGKFAPGRIVGYDRDPLAVRIAAANAARAGLAGLVDFRRCELASLPPAPAPHGLVAVNPPYGERLGEVRELVPLYALLGSRLREGYAGWQAAILTGNAPLGLELGLKAKRTHRMMNGPIECRLLRIDVGPASVVEPREPGRPRHFDAAAARARPGSQMFANRLRKNCAALGKWARREAVSCYRLYDADMPEYAFAIDLYQADPAGEGGRWLYVQEYAPPATVDRAAARLRREEALATLAEVTGVPEAGIFMRTRRPQKGASQYEKVAERGEFTTVEEAGLRFLVNFTDYLDTGLFLDHRTTRARLREAARGRRFLNLFCYTGSASVHAAAGGAAGTTSVDMSRTYLDWARRNLELNGFHGPAHEFIQENAIDWLAQDDGRRWDLAFLDPPTFSNSKRMEREFDVQRDHVELIRNAMKRLTPGGLLVFSTNFRRFRLDAQGLAGLAIRDVTAATIPQDYARNARIHQCFEIRTGS